MQRPNFNSFPTLSSERLDFRQYRLSDRNEIYRLRSDEVVLKYLELPVAQNLNDAEDFINLINDGTVIENKWITWGFCLKGSDQLIGSICLWNCDFETASAELGYSLLPEFFQQGYMSEATKITLDMAFNTFGFKEIDAITHRKNIGSLRLLEKFDFQYDDLFECDDVNMVRYSLKVK